MTPLDFMQTLMALDAMYPLSISGGKRTQKRNEQVGGHSNSRHLVWQAVDVVLDDMSPDNIMRFVQECRRQGLVAVNENDHIHVQVP